MEKYTKQYTICRNLNVFHSSIKSFKSENYIDTNKFVINPIILRYKVYQN